MKRIVSIVLALIMLLSTGAAIPVTVSAAATPELTEVVAADRFVKAYKALDKLYRTCMKNSKESYFEKDGYTYVRYRVKAKKFNTKKKVLTYLKKYFSKSAAAQIYRDHFTEKNGKLYVSFILFGYDSALVNNDVFVKKIKHAENKEIVTFGLLWTGPEDSFENTTAKLSMVYEGGRWVFAKNSFWRGDNYANEAVITPGDGK